MWNNNPPNMLESIKLWKIDKILTLNTHKIYISWSHEATIWTYISVFFLIYIVKLTLNNEYVFLSFIFEIKVSCASNTTFLIRWFQFFKCTLKTNINKWNIFPVQAHWNRLVLPPHQVITNIGSILYYKMNQKSIDGTSVLT